MKSYPIERARHVVLRAGAGDALPGDVTRALTEHGVASGWLRASGVLTDVELRVFDSATGSPARSRRIAGPVQALAIEGSIGLDRGEPTIGLRAVIGRETDRGTEVLAGEIVSARVVAFEAFVTAFDDVVLSRAVDASAKVALFSDGVLVPAPPSPVAATRPSSAPSVVAAPAPPAPVAAAPPVAAPPPIAVASPAPPPVAAAPPSPPTQAPAAVQAPAAAWSEAITASTEQDAPRPAVNRGALGGAIPARLVRPAHVLEEALQPQPGDVVEHFAFGRAEVVKTDGERLHLQVANGRVREIAIEMLKVSPLPSDGPHRRFRLDRRM